MSSIIKKYFDTSYVIQTLILIILLTIGGIVFKQPIALWFGGILLFTAIDCLGFHFLLTQEESIPVNKSSIENASYRIIQTICQILIAGFIATFNWYAAIAFVFCWWMSLCDWLFYIILKQNYKFTDAPWLAWSIPGILSKLFTGQIGWKWMVTFSILSILISVAVMVIFK